MKKKLNEYVGYRGDRLFDGAVDVSWLINDREKALIASSAFVFHGPEYHGVSQQDIGTTHGHKLVDTASFTIQILKRCNGREDRPFTLAIAGYGTGKSHLATALSIMLSEPGSKASQNVLANLCLADKGRCEDFHQEIDAFHSPALVISLNGMGNFDLAAEFNRQIMHYLYGANVDAHALDALRPRFKTAANLARRLTPQESTELAIECGLPDVSEVARRLQEHDETVYGVAHEYLSRLGFQIKTIGDETVKDVIETVCREYVGEHRPFSRLVVLFDEFGRYAEFATVRSQIAGSGVLQQLFEGIQSCSEKATFVGFIQFDLNTYVQRMGQEYRNEILRVSTRYQSAEKTYLSINLETLLANLLEKKVPGEINGYFDCEEEQVKSEACMKMLNAWFPQSKNHRLWSESSSFHQIIRKGCWPLSPYAGWLLFHLAAAGQHLQQRSALSILDEAYKRYQNHEISGYDWQLHATEIWSKDLEKEFLISEESGSRGSITHAYTNIMAKIGQHITPVEEKLLRSIVLSSKLGIVSQNRIDATTAMAALSGVTSITAEKSLKVLEDERNIIGWDDRFNQFEIIGDTVSRPQFLSFLKQKVTDKYDEHAKSQLFLRTVRTLCPELLRDGQTDFAEKHNISTPEWLFASAITNLDELPRIIDESVRGWKAATAIDQPRGSVIYCYIEPKNNISKIQTETTKRLKTIALGEKQKSLPLLIVFLHDIDGQTGQLIAELTVLTEDISKEEMAKFGNLVGAHRQKCQELLISNIEGLIKQRNYATLLSLEEGSQKIDSVCSALFEHIYPKVLPFPFDGFSTIRGNAADTCYNLTLDLIRGHLTYNEVLAKPVRDKNRANEVLKNCWQIFLKNGDVSQRPDNDEVRGVFVLWENMLKDRIGLINMADMVKIACLPPYGANLSSAVLLLSVYLCARQKVFLIRRSDAQFELSDLNGDMLFRGKTIDLAKLKELFLIAKSAEEGSEWDAFLDEWELAADRSYDEQVNFLHRRLELERRIRPPKAQSYRIDLLEERAHQASEKLASYTDKVDRAFSLIEKGAKNFDFHSHTYGVVKLKEAIGKMRSDPLYSSKNADNYQEKVDFHRQLSIQNFESWLSNQAPRGRTTKDVSDFERFMKETASNLKRLELFEQADTLELAAAKAARQINLIAEAQTLCENIDGWLTAHSASRSLKIVDLRDNIDTAKEYMKKAMEIAQTVKFSGIETVRQKLDVFIKNNKKLEKEFSSRLARLIEKPFKLSAIDEVIQEINELERIFDRCDSDMEELQSMRRALRFFKDAATQLFNETISEEAFKHLFNELSKKANAELSDDEPPWMPEEVMPLIYKEAMQKRESMGEEWLSKMSDEVNKIKGFDIAKANNLYNALQCMPGYLSKTFQNKAIQLREKVEAYLNTLKVEWLKGKFQELDKKSQHAFLEAIGISLK